MQKLPKKLNNYEDIGCSFMCLVFCIVLEFYSIYFAADSMALSSFKFFWWAP